MLAIEIWIQTPYFDTCIECYEAL